jgi:hypothetical protein
MAEAQLVALMVEIFDAADGNYGVPRMHKDLRNAVSVAMSKSSLVARKSPRGG